MQGTVPAGPVILYAGWLACGSVSWMSGFAGAAAGIFRGVDT